jgi:replicative DNA helicase
MNYIADTQLEAAVLSAILTESKAQIYLDEIREDFFTEMSHIGVFRAMDRLKKRSEAIDLLTVAKEADGSPSRLEVAKLTTFVTSSANIETHIKKLYELSALRALQRVNNRLNTLSNSSDPFNVAEALQIDLDLIRNNMGGEPKSLERITGHAIQHLQDNLGKGIGLSSGWPRLDQYTGGMPPGELWIIAGRPGMGKTAFATEILREHCNQGGKGLFISLEMDNKSLAMRMISGELSINGEKIRAGNITPDDLVRMHIHRDKLADVPLWFEDTTGMTIDMIRGRVRQMKAKHGITAVAIDYIGLIEPSNKNAIREQQVAYISAMGKRIAKESQVTVIMLSQLNRGVEARADKRPNMSDLRESGAIEQDADLILFPYRPSYYESNTGQVAETAEIIVGKNRNGTAKGFLEATFIPQFAKYELR